MPALGGTSNPQMCRGDPELQQGQSTHIPRTLSCEGKLSAPELGKSSLLWCPAIYCCFVNCLRSWGLRQQWFVVSPGSVGWPGSSGPSSMVSAEVIHVVMEVRNPLAAAAAGAGWASLAPRGGVQHKLSAGTPRHPKEGCSSYPPSQDQPRVRESDSAP